MEQKFNEQDSLQLISEMIAQTRSNIGKGDAFSYLVIGYALVVASLLDAILMYVLTPSYMAHWIWALLGPVLFISFYKNGKDGKKAIVRTHMDTITTAIWVGFMIALILLFGILFGFAYATRNDVFMWMITPSVLILTGLGQYVTAATCKYKPFYWGAWGFWLGAIACFIYYVVAHEPAGQYVIFALCIAVGYIVPGHMLNRKTEKNV
ncbi:hypothetical protein [Parabacteroides sp. PF5-9]|uniref:hypothetical protein n=1 Tax=Parabacteroides sp. PF5-9 TaxID=1742404 RepID=UPI002473DCC8|nr:hypothetical protein [Parabacteroides sp. PF5-9]MDH6357548.1 VIT1/CCC1 family predicted Fe2+/Mn2+ transporter [Parabacteroides sp. PF5-9]